MSKECDGCGLSVHDLPDEVLAFGVDEALEQFFDRGDDGRLLCAGCIGVPGGEL